MLKPEVELGAECDYPSLHEAAGLRQMIKRRSRLDGGGRVR